MKRDQNNGIKRIVRLRRSETPRSLCLIMILFSMFILSGCNNTDKKTVASNDYPPIYPDYINVTVPYNIAPLNFRINGAYRKMHVTFRGRAGQFLIKSGEKISIPAKSWKKLLNEQKNDSIIVSVEALSGNEWKRFRSFSIIVSADPIDPCLTYRLIEPGYEVYNRLQICERDLENFHERVIVDNKLVDNGCVNCHTFNHQDPSMSYFHLRNKDGGTMVQVGGVFRKINTKTDSTISAGVYGNWHPGGRFIAFSTNVIIPEFHSINNLRLEVYDTISDVIVLDLARNEVVKNSLLSSAGAFETFPAFSADGKKLFFCSAKALKMPENYNRIRYSLCSVDFNESDGTFGNHVDTLISSFRTGSSVSEPKPSPDGKYILYTSFAYGNFPVWHREADLHLLNLKDNSVDTLATVNSGNSDSYHSWSSGSRWFVFASKRDNGMYGKPYFAHIDENGKCSKPFVLPQKDADFYDMYMKSFNIPELSKGPIPYNPMDVEKAFRKLKAEAVKFTRK